jgi:protein-S-isoprenylcysteine O-methyltransferase Ste14
MEGMFAKTRNPNYFGEMSLYLSFAIVVGNWKSYIMLILIWSTLFYKNMLN